MNRLSRGVLFISIFLLTLLAAVEAFDGRSQRPPVAPARVLPMQNHEVDAGKSGRPAQVPLSWGRLAAMQNLGGGNYLLVFEADSGELYFVRLLQRGDYLYLDTRDEGGVALMLSRK